MVTRGPAVYLCGGGRDNDATRMCVRHASVYGPWTYTPVPTADCPLPADDVGHGDVEAGPDEGGPEHPMSYAELTGHDPDD